MHIQTVEGTTVKLITCFACGKEMVAKRIVEKKGEFVVQYKCACGAGSDRLLSKVEDRDVQRLRQDIADLTL
jgi:hypothetical protein